MPQKRRSIFHPSSCLMLAWLALIPALLSFFVTSHVFCNGFQELTQKNTSSADQGFPEADEAEVSECSSESLEWAATGFAQNFSFTDQSLHSSFIYVMTYLNSGYGRYLMRPPDLS